ncbi:MAG: glycosyltransferase [Saccharofermentanales bacterium]
MISGQFNDSFQPITDGVAAVTRNYALGLGRLTGTEGGSYVITPSFPGFTDPDESYTILRYRSIPMVNRPPYRIGLPKLDLPFMRKLDAIPFDIVHAQCPFSAGRLAMQVAKQKNIPFVASFHTKYLEDILPIARSEKLSKQVLHIIMKIYNKADAVWTVNEASVETLREYGYQGPVHVVENGTDLAAARPETRRSSAGDRVAAELKIREDEPVFFFIGQHIWQKNLRLLCESLQILKEKMLPANGEGRAFRMFFIGGGDATDDMKKMIEASHLENEVTFLGVVRDREFVRGMYERSDLLLFPSLYDTSALVLRESAATLCPLVLIDGASIAEGIKDGDNGFLSANTPGDFADTILRAMSEPGLRQSVGLRAQQTLYRSWDTVVGEVYAEYQNIIERYNNKKIL